MMSASVLRKFWKKGNKEQSYLLLAGDGEVTATCILKNRMYYIVLTGGCRYEPYTFLAATVYLSQSMEEPVFIKCEPAWPSDAEQQSSDLEHPPWDKQMKIKEDPYSAVAELCLEEVKELCSDEDEKEEECNNSGGSSHEIHPSSFSTSTNITLTISDDSEIKPVTTDIWNCRSCGRSFEDEDLLMNHMEHNMKHTFQTTCCPEDGTCPLFGKDLYCCANCNKKFTQKKHLVQHVVIHTGQKPHSCSVCGKSFALRLNLQSHISIHKGIKPYICPNCGVAFNRRSCLINHQAIHSTSKPYVCSICGNAFRQQSALKHHSVVHIKEKPFSCKICTKSFSRADNLKAHMLVHDKTLSHPCATCGKTFRHLITLKRHIVKNVSCQVPGLDKSRL